MDERMEIDKSAVDENGSNLYPVSANASGEGLPYAPIDWPNPGDKWRWKVGRRVSPSGHFVDRLLYSPGKSVSFRSQLSVKQYIKSAFHDADVDAFFASFSWRIPSKERIRIRERPREGKKKSKIKNKTKITAKVVGRARPLAGRTSKRRPGRPRKRTKLEEGQDEGDVEDEGEVDRDLHGGPNEPESYSKSNSQSGNLSCRTGNRMCRSLTEIPNPQLEVTSCDVCCSEPGFCRDCCCILCCLPVSSAFDIQSYIRCEAAVADGYICGHVAHIECSIRAQVAGTVGGSIGLDAEYLCRRCDSRTNIVPHVEKLLCTSKSCDSRDDCEKILKICSSLLRDSQKIVAEQLFHRIESALAKLKSGTDLEDVWKEDVPAFTEEVIVHDGKGELGNHREESDHTAFSPPKISKFDCHVESLRLEDEINQVLLTLKKSQESDYMLVVEKLSAQKVHVQKLYQKLDKEKSELLRCASSTDREALLDTVFETAEKVRREFTKLKDMEAVAKGFVRTSKHVLKEHFGLDLEN